MSEDSSGRPETEDPVGLTMVDGVATITLSRPDAMNALDTGTKVALRDAVTRVAHDDDVRCVLLTGAGRAFCVGQDLREHVSLLRARDASMWRTVPEHYNPVALGLATMPKPVVAAVNGVAAGAGAAFAMAADLRIVAASAGFNLAFAAVALSADSGSSWWLPRLVGMTRAKELLLMPRTVPAEEALAIGLATEVVSDEDLGARAHEVAARLAAGPTLAYAAIRRAVAFSATHHLEDALAKEGELMTLTGRTADHVEAVEAFLGNRRPTFTGH